MSRALWNVENKTDVLEDELNWKMISDRSWIYEKNKSKTWSSQNIFLNDQTMFWIVISSIFNTNRNRFWSLNFSLKEYSVIKNQDKEIAAKILNSVTKEYHYVIVCEQTQLHGQEEKKENLKRIIVTERIVTAT